MKQSKPEAMKIVPFELLATTRIRFSSNGFWINLFQEIKKKTLYNVVLFLTVNYVQLCNCVQNKICNAIILFILLTYKYL